MSKRRLAGGWSENILCLCKGVEVIVSFYCLDSGYSMLCLVFVILANEYCSHLSRLKIASEFRTNQGSETENIAFYAPFRMMQQNKDD